jgi:hypothetical protein
MDEEPPRDMIDTGRSSLNEEGEKRCHTALARSRGIEIETMRCR